MIAETYCTCQQPTETERALCIECGLVVDNSEANAARTAGTKPTGTETGEQPCPKCSGTMTSHLPFCPEMSDDLQKRLDFAATALCVVERRRDQLLVEVQRLKIENEALRHHESADTGTRRLHQCWCGQYHSDTRALKAAAPRELTLQDFGYAPGNYAIKCLDCGQESLWCDKRAARCETCAKQAMTENRGLSLESEKTS